MIEMINEEYTVARDAAQSIADHYSQDIHIANISEPFPYFDPLYGKPTILTRFTKHWCDELNQRTRCNFAFFNIFSRLIESYSEIIRLKCFSFSEKKKILQPSCYIILIQFEQMLSNYLTAHSEHAKNNDIDISSDQGEEILNRIFCSIETIVMDIFSVTPINMISMRWKTDSENKQCQFDTTSIICNYVLPTLLRIMNHCLQLQRTLLLRTQNTLTTYELGRHKYLLTLTTLVTLSFCQDESYSDREFNPTKLTSSDIHVRQIVPQHLFKEFTLNHIFFDKSSYPPNILSSKCGSNKYLDGLLEFAGLSKASLAVMEENIVDFNCKSASLPMPWLDHTKGIGMRAARSILQSLGTLAKLLDNQAKGMHSQSSRQESVLDIIIKAIGEDYAAETARENFFGRHQLFRSTKPSDHGIPNILSPQSSAFNGVSQSAPKKEHIEDIQSYSRPPSKGSWMQTDDRIQQLIPAIIPSSVRLLGAFKFPSIASSVWDHALPIIFTLIDSCDENQQSLGASLLLLFLNESTFTAIMTKGRAHCIEGVLSLACRTCNSPIPLSLLLTARCRLLKNISSNKENDSVRSNALINSFIWIQKNSYCGPGGESEDLEKICAVLVCSIQPLLEQLVQSSDVSATELGRFGLKVLLGLIRWDSKNEKSKKVQIAAVACLISLMFGAYPIMDRHGGKVMSELIACFCREERRMIIYDKMASSACNSVRDPNESKETTLVRILMLSITHAASICLVICRCRANNIIVKVEKGNFSSRCKDWCKLVRSGASIMKDNDLKHETADSLNFNL